MLKRFQVLMEDWQADYIRLIGDLYDLSFSESCRFLFSLGALQAVNFVRPEYKVTVDKKLVRKFVNENASQEDKHQVLSKLYFETRKAIEYRKSKLKKRNNNH